MFCENCGYKLSDDACFCPNCGCKVNATSADAQNVTYGNNANNGSYSDNANNANNGPYSANANNANNGPYSDNVNTVNANTASEKANILPDNKVADEALDAKKRKRKKIIGITAISLVSLIVVIGVVFLLFNLFGKKVTFSEFKADFVCLASEQPEDITFTVKADANVDEIELVRGDSVVSTMKDDGKNGDIAANDGIYTCVVKVKEKVNKYTEFDYYCRYKKNVSEPLTLYCFSRLDEESAEQAKTDYISLYDSIREAQEEFVDSNNCISPDKQADAVEKVVEIIEQAEEDDIVAFYETEGNSVFIKLRSGLSMIYQPKTEGTDAVGDGVEMTIFTVQPHYTEMGGSSFGTGYTGYQLPNNASHILGMIDASAQDLKNTLPNYKFLNSRNYDDGDVTLDVVRSFGKDQVILWHGHGYYGPIVKSCLVVAEPFDWEAWWLDWEYYTDCVTNRIANSFTMTGHSNVVISSGYIEKYCGDMTNSFVYLGACSSGKDSGLPEAFSSKGAAVVANSETILRVYNVAMLYGTVNQMLKVDPQTGTFFTLEKALDNAKQIYGASDADSRYGGIGATPMIFGGDAAKDYRFAETVPTGTISGRVCKASDRTTAIPSAEIEVFIGGVSFKKATVDSDGQYEIELPIGDCEIKITAEGYISFTSYNNVRAGSTLYMETFLMVEGDASQIGKASGKVVNSISGQVESNVSLAVYNNWNNANSSESPIQWLTTNYSGEYSVELPLGNYTLVAEKENFSKSHFNIIVQQGETPNQDGTITPAINGNDYLITLTWGANPDDVDSHMVGKTSSGNSFHVYFSNMRASSGGNMVCNLDYDDTTSYGPEHITLSADSTEPYYYYLHRYSGSGSLATSGAKVTVEQGGVKLAEFHVPTNLGTADYWNVFAIKDGEFVVSNTITESPNTTYAD